MRHESIEFLIQQLSEEDIVITVNQRLAALITDAYDQRQQQNGLNIWVPINSLSLNNWLINQWQALNPTSTVLNTLQETALWKQVIQQKGDSIPFLQVTPTAQLVQQAWHLLHHFELQLSQLDEYPNQQVDCFINWAVHFQAYCQPNLWLTLSELPTQLITHWQQNPPRFASKLFFVGFDEFSPLLKSFIAHLQQLTQLIIVPILGKPGLCQRIELENQDSEIAHFAAWAVELLTNEPKIKIGCIVPNLSTCRQNIINEFTNTFAIDNKLSAYLNATPSRFIYNISAGQSLTDFEAIYIALQIIQLLEGNFSLETIGLLLQSPYLMHETTDGDTGALLDYSLREYGFTPKLPLETLLSSINRTLQLSSKQTDANDPSKLFNWKQRWQNFYHAYKQQPEINFPSQWAVYFESQLKRLGWPGRRQRNSVEFQLMQRWQQLLGEMAYLDSICGSISFNEAFNWLQSLASQTLFQAQGNSQASLQILGILESVGYQFDALWIMGLHDENWPPAENPNPFLPFKLQQELEMPHASASRQLNYTQKINERLLCSAKQIILSSPSKDGEKILRPSKLIEKFPLMNLSQLPLCKQEPFIEKIFASRQLETSIDEIAPPVKTAHVVSGGSSILTEQATCPFRAFALKRLRAKSLPKITFFSNQHRGILLHHALAILWSQFKTQTNFLDYAESEINDLVTDCIQTAIKSLFNNQQRKLLKPILEIEEKCLFKLIGEWLQLERQRPHFEVIACEYQHSLEIGPLKLRVQIDRIDQLNDGSHMILDYKTSASLSIQSWVNAPLEQPQLPFYSLAFQDKCTAISYAQIRADKIQFKGLCAENHPNPIGEITGIIPIHQVKTDVIPKDWEEMQIHWQTELTQLAENFYHGDATIKPIHDKKTCQQCELNNLCRYR